MANNNNDFENEEFDDDEFYENPFDAFGDLMLSLESNARDEALLKELFKNAQKEANLEDDDV